MNAFDSVEAKCPNCGTLVEFQSKAGSRTLARYHPSRVPQSIALDLSDTTEVCSCGTVVQLHYEGREERVAMRVNIKGDEDEVAQQSRRYSHPCR